MMRTEEVRPRDSCAVAPAESACEASHDLDEPGARHAVAEAEGVGEGKNLVAAHALEAAREILEHRLREEDVPDEPVDPRALAERERIEVGELAARRKLG